MASHAQGTTLTFAGVAYTVTNVTYSMTDVAAGDTIDVSHLSQSAGSSVLTMDRPLRGSATDTGREVSMEYLGNAPITDGSTGTLVIAGGPLALSAAATVSSSSVTLAVNDAVRGQATFRVARV
jgi:hypothetical protein